jgi:hypothetical protein
MDMALKLALLCPILSKWDALFSPWRFWDKVRGDIYLNTIGYGRGTLHAP